VSAISIPLVGCGIVLHQSPFASGSFAKQFTGFDFPHRSKVNELLTEGDLPADGKVAFGMTSTASATTTFRRLNQPANTSA